MRTNSLTLIMIVMTSIMLCGCHTQKDLAYFENLQNSSSGNIKMSDYNIKIVPQDELMILVNSEVPSASDPFNASLTNTISRGELPLTAITSPASVASASGTNRRMTYIVDKQGDIEFPILGKIHVGGMTTAQLSDYLKERIGHTVEDPQVYVHLVNFKVKVLGEVRAPQTINVNTEKFSIIDALSACGDLSDYGKRDNIIVMRERSDGTLDYARVDLHDTNLFSSPYFYLQQNDIIYVEPNNIKQSNSKYNFHNSYKLSATSTIISAASVIASLVIALTVK